MKRKKILNDIQNLNYPKSEKFWRYINDKSIKIMTQVLILELF